MLSGFNWPQAFNDVLNWKLVDNYLMHTGVTEHSLFFFKKLIGESPESHLVP